MTKRAEVFQSIAAIGGLIVGLFVYFLDRHPQSVYFIPDWFSLTTNIGPVFGHIGNHLPTFVHVYIFILLTTAVTKPSPALVIPICAAWFVTDSIFEIAQITFIAQWISENVPSWFKGIPFLENTADYFLSGTFDVLDLCSILLGTISAFLTVVISYRRENQHDTHV